MDKKSIVKRKDKFTYLTASEMLDFQTKRGIERTTRHKTRGKFRIYERNTTMDEHGGVLVRKIHLLMV